MSALAPTLEAFFTERLMAQRRASPNTVAAYRDAFCVLLAFIERETGKAPAKLQIEDLDAPLVSVFLNHLERERGNGAPPSRARRGDRAGARHPPEALRTARRAVPL
jgi:integrase/recombinase XerD